MVSSSISFSIIYYLSWLFSSNRFLSAFSFFNNGLSKHVLSAFSFFSNYLSKLFSTNYFLSTLFVLSNHLSELFLSILFYSFSLSFNYRWKLLLFFDYSNYHFSLPQQLCWSLHLLSNWLRSDLAITRYYPMILYPAGFHPILLVPIILCALRPDAGTPLTINNF